MADSKWLESWEKNFDTTFKSLSKFKDDLKQKPSNLNSKTQKRCSLYLDLLIVELEELKENFGKVEIKGKSENISLEQVGTR